MDRILSIASDPGSVVVDPFGGSGTTYVAAELLGRKWLGMELDCSPIVTRFEDLEGDRQNLHRIHRTKNRLFTQQSLRLREQNGFSAGKYRIEPSLTEKEPELLILE